MSVSNFVSEPSSLSIALQMRESHQAISLGERDLFLPESIQAMREESSFQWVKRDLRMQEGKKLSLQFFLKHTGRLSKAEITQAFFKQKGYFARLFSKETWEEWTDNRTALGKVAAHFMDCIASQTEARVCIVKLDKHEFEQANEEAAALLMGKSFRKTTLLPNSNMVSWSPSQFQTQSFCVPSLISGMAASIITKNPLPSLLGFSTCLPGAFAQQKIGNEFQVNTYINNNQMSPAAKGLSNGNFVVTWQSDGQDGSLYGVFGQLFAANASKLGSEFQANTFIDFSQASSSIAGLKNGSFVVSWTSVLQRGIIGQLFDGSARRIGNDEFLINADPLRSQDYSSATGLPNGNFVVAWQVYQSDQLYDIHGQLFAGNASKIGTDFRVNTFTSNNQFWPAATGLSNGNFVVTWQSWDQDGSSYGVFGQLFTGNAGKIGNEFRVNTFTSLSQKDPSATSLQDGNFVVTWSSAGQDGSGYGVFGQVFDENANKIGNEFQVNTYTLNDQSYPSVASLSNSSFVVTWQSDGQDGSGYGILGQLFDENANKIGYAFQVNTNTISDQRMPSATSLQDGNFVVTWTSLGQDGSLEGVFGQLFNDILKPSSTTISTTSVTTTTASTTSISTTFATTTTESTTSIGTTSVTTPTATTTSSISTTTTASTTSSSSTTSAMTNTETTSSSMPPTSSIHPTRYSMTSSPMADRKILWISVGAGGLFCFCMTSLGYLWIRKRKSLTETHFSEEGRLSTTAYDLDSVVQKHHKLIGKVYYQLSTLAKEEAEAIYLQTGHLIPFPEGQKKFRYVIGSGNFGKIKVAQRKEDRVFVASKKVTGEENIRVSDAEAQMQKEAAGDNVLPIYNTIRLEEALYHFMPLAGLGDGSTIQKRLAVLNQSSLASKILQFIAKNILTGLQTIHGKGIYHLDMKPDNLVFTKDGTAYITDFGCAKRLENPQLTREAIGDNRYFSPERLSACEGGTFDAEKADIWAAGVTLLQIFYNKGPLELFNMPQRLAARVERCNQAHFDEQLQLQRFGEVEKGSILWVIKGLLDTNPTTRLSAKKALEVRCFYGLDQNQQERAFEDLRRETFAQHRGIETSHVKLGDYKWVMEEAPEEEKAREYQSTSDQEFYGYGLTPEFYQRTPDHVTAPLPSSSGYLFTP